MSKILLEDKIFEESISTKLEESRQLVQNCLDAWNSLQLDPVTGHSGLYELLFSPDILFNESVNRLKIVEGVDEKTAARHAASVQVPYPEKLYQACEKARRNGYTTRELSLFDTDGQKVTLVQKVAKNIIKSKTVYSENSNQESHFNELTGLVENLNKLNDAVSGKLLDDNCRTLGRVFSTPTREVEGYHTVSLNPSGLREILERIH